MTVVGSPLIAGLCSGVWVSEWSGDGTWDGRNDRRTLNHNLIHQTSSLQPYKLKAFKIAMNYSTIQCRECSTHWARSPMPCCLVPVCYEWCPSHKLRMLLYWVISGSQEIHSSSAHTKTQLNTLQHVSSKLVQINSIL